MSGTLAYVFTGYVACMIALGLARLWSLWRLAGMLPEGQRREFLSRFESEPAASPAEWESRIGAGAATLVSFNRMTARLAIYATAVFAAVYLGISYLT